jgi:hypothetical protein
MRYQIFQFHMKKIYISGVFTFSNYKTCQLLIRILKKIIKVYNIIMAI